MSNIVESTSSTESRECRPGWRSVPLKHWVAFNPEVLLESTEPGYILQYLDIGSVSTGRIVAAPDTYRFADAPSRARRIVRKGDAIISTVRTYLKATYSFSIPPDNLIVSTGFAVARPKDQMRASYLGYLFQEAHFVDEVVARSEGVAYPAITEPELGRIVIAVPPLDEQIAIANFLDVMDARITKYIVAKRKMIALLEERKQAIINQAVTRGLDPDVPLKPSGVDWLGDIPAHWERRSIGQLFAHGRGVVTSHEYIAEHPGPYPLYSSQTANDGIMGFIDSYMFDGEYLTWTTDGANAGTVFRREGKFNCTNVCGTLKPTITMNLAYVRAALSVETKRFVRPDINPKLMNNVMARIQINLAPVNEQHEIASRLEKEFTMSDKVIAQSKREIVLVQEYRTRLISDVVTGKLDVRGVRFSDPPELSTVP